MGYVLVITEKPSVAQSLAAVLSANKRWSYDILPILPDVWKYRASDGKKKQLDVLRSLMNRTDSRFLSSDMETGLPVAEIYDTTQQNISQHIDGIFKDDELDVGKLCCKWHTNQCLIKQGREPFAAQVERPEEKKGEQKLLLTITQPT